MERWERSGVRFHKRYDTPMFKRIVELDPIVQHELLLRMMVEAC